MSANSNSDELCTVFLSHSHVDRIKAGRIKKHLEGEFGIRTFVAHDDLKVSQKWRILILRNLRSCSMLVALLSEDFLGSYWTNQELGYAHALRRIIVPIKLKDGPNPFGFIEDLQAAKWDPKTFDANMNDIVNLLIEEEKFPIDSFIQLFRKVGNYKTAIEKLEFLLKLDTKLEFSPRQTIEIAKVSLVNDQIYGSSYAPYYVQRFLKKHESVLSFGLIQKLKRKKLFSEEDDNE